MGPDFKTVEIRDAVYVDIEKVLKDFPEEVRLKILDGMYLKICNQKKKRN